jgi:hypothetical protein
MEGRTGVVVGVDGSPESRVALHFALAGAARRGVGVRVVVAPEYWAASYGLSALPPVEQVVADNEVVAREAVADAVADDAALADVPVEVVALPGPPARVLIERTRARLQAPREVRSRASRGRPRRGHRAVGAGQRRRRIRRRHGLMANSAGRGP